MFIITAFNSRVRGNISFVVYHLKSDWLGELPTYRIVYYVKSEWLGE
jgi:hypothetical protein